MAEQAQNPNLMSKEAMTAMASTSGVAGETVHEIFTKVNNLKNATADDTEMWMSIANVLGWPTWQLEPKKSNNTNQRLAEIFERNIKLGNNRFEIQIKPENLGKVEVIMEINGDSVDITFKVENNNVASFSFSCIYFAMIFSFFMYFNLKLVVYCVSICVLFCFQ